MVPLREQAERWARDRWPWLDATRRALVADLAARVERVRIWSDDNDILLGRTGRATRAHPIVDSADRWQARLETLIERLDAEARERASGSQDPQASLDAVLAEIAAENDEVEP